jgi:hypothetical protein
MLIEQKVWIVLEDTGHADFSIIGVYHSEAAATLAQLEDPTSRHIEEWEVQ